MEIDTLIYIGTFGEKFSDVGLFLKVHQFLHVTIFQFRKKVKNW